MPKSPGAAALVRPPPLARGGRARDADLTRCATCHRTPPRASSRSLAPACDLFPPCHFAATPFRRLSSPVPPLSPFFTRPTAPASNRHDGPVGGGELFAAARRVRSPGRANVCLPPPQAGAALARMAVPEPHRTPALAHPPPLARGGRAFHATHVRCPTCHRTSPRASSRSLVPACRYLPSRRFAATLFWHLRAPVPPLPLAFTRYTTHARNRFDGLVGGGERFAAARGVRST
jgi:hypothetical protein